MDYSCSRPYKQTKTLFVDPSGPLLSPTVLWTGWTTQKLLSLNELSSKNLAPRDPGRLEYRVLQKANFHCLLFARQLIT